MFVLPKGEATMSIMHCNKHGTWNLNVSASCPRCWEENRKTFLGMTGVSWFLFGYIAAVLIAMAWIVTAHAGGT